MIDNNFTQSFLNPRSVAIVGASSNPQKTGARVQRFLVSHGYKGKIYPVNPNREEIFGFKCYSKLTNIPQKIDHVFIAVDGNKIIDAVRDAVSMNIKCATILSGGFSESGSEGLNLEKQILHIAREGNLRILGPNSIGIINISDSVVLSANAMLDLPNLKKGGLSVISQSGSLIGALIAHGHSRGIGFSKLFSVGNESDLTVGEIGKMLIDDNDTHTIILFLETLRNSEEVSEMARLAYASGKSVITYKLGKSDLGKELAKSHTGAIAGSDEAFNAFVKYNGIKRVEIFESLIEIPNLFKNKILPVGKRIAIVTTTGGGGAMVVESLSGTDIEVIDPSSLISKLIEKHNINLNQNKVVDLTIAGTKPEVVSDAIKYFMDNNNCDLVVMVVGSSAKFRSDQAVEPLVKFGKYKKPLAVYIAPDAPEALKLLHQHDIACFRTPESCAEGIRAYLNTKAPKINIEKNYNLKGVSDKLKGYPHKNLSEKNSLEIFKEIGINTVHFEIFSNEEQAKYFASILGFPVAIKILSNDFLHKTEIGGVELNINSMESLISSYQKLSKISNDLNIKENEKKFLMQKMEKGLTEIILGYRIDELVGPIVMIGSGGVMSEIFDDKSIRIAPVEMSDAMEMIKEVKSLISVQGFRGLPKGDMKVLAQAIVQISQLASVREIKDAEINPIIIKEGQEGLVAVDGLITLN
ncbi:MAG: acetate--CoA ligase family protein [Alphaproteobacteria bacterium]|nr:acetate--CoA ligase family protein [Alphaproteobacteria bacterium]